MYCCHQKSLEEELQLEIETGTVEMVENYLIHLNETPNTPPTDLTLDPELLTYLSDTNQIVVVGSNIVYSRTAYDQQVDEVLKHIERIRIN